MVIPKKNEGRRVLFIPPSELKTVQRKILNWMRRFPGLIGHFGINGLTGGSCTSHVRYHANSRWFFSFDLKDAFYSVDISRIKRILRLILQKQKERALCYVQEGEEAKEELLSLDDVYEGFTEDPLFGGKDSHRKALNCIIRYGSRPDITNMAECSPEELTDLTELIMQLTTYNNLIPQGAPTSPLLFWCFLDESCKDHDKGLYYSISSPVYNRQWHMSCYVDGFVISGSKPVPRDVIVNVFSKVRKAGFKIHKISHRDLRHGSPTICGLRISADRIGEGENKVVLPKKTIRKWRGIIGRARFDTNSELIRRISGFIGSIRPLYKDKLPPQIVSALLKIGRYSS